MISEKITYQIRSKCSIEKELNIELSKKDMVHNFSEQFCIKSSLTVVDLNFAKKYDTNSSFMSRIIPPDAIGLIPASYDEQFSLL